MPIGVRFVLCTCVISVAGEEGGEEVVLDHMPASGVGVVVVHPHHKEIPRSGAQVSVTYQTKRRVSMLLGRIIGSSKLEDFGSLPPKLQARMSVPSTTRPVSECCRAWKVLFIRPDYFIDTIDTIVNVDDDALAKAIKTIMITSSQQLDEPLWPIESMRRFFFHRN